MTLQLKLLGRPTVAIAPDGDSPLPSFSHKALGLVYYLAVTRQPYSRESLAGLLWSDANDERARRSLRVVLSQLRPHLEPYLDIQRRSVAFDTQSDHTVDVVVFETNLNRPEPTLPQIEAAVALYQDDFLTDFSLRGAPLFEEWQLIQRERLRQMALDGLHKLAAAYMVGKQYEAGITAVRRLLILEPWLESAHRQLMRLLVLNGQRSAALTQFEQCRQVLAEELGVEPSSETSDLHLQILNDEIGMDDEGVALVVVAPPPPAVSPFQAPQLTQYFVGRIDESEQIAAQVSGQVGLIGLVGMGGIGKTTLATHMAHLLKDDFPDGVLWAASAQVEPLDVLASWGQAFGYDFSGLRDVQNRAAAVRGMLTDKRCLLIIDDVSSVARIRPLLVGGGRCATLLTTRSFDVAYGLEAQVLTVGELPTAEGLALLTGILGEKRVAAEAEAAEAICAQLHNLPLALEIAAKRLKSRQRRKLADMAKRLAEMQNRLGLEISDHAVRASFEVSWGALDGELKRIFQLLGSFAGLSFTAEALAAVAEIDRYDAEDYLFSLVALSLVKEEGDEAYQQHLLLADFAGEKLAADGSEEAAEVNGRMAEYYQQFAAVYGRDYEALAPWWANFMAGVRVAHKQADWPLMIGYLQALDEPWFRRGRFDDFRTAFGLARTLKPAQSEAETVAWIYLRSSKAAYEQDQFAEAEQLLKQCLGYAIPLDNRQLLATAYFQLGHIHMESSDYEKALASFDKSEQIQKWLEDELGIAEVYYGKALLYRYFSSNYDQAGVYANYALQILADLPPSRILLETLRLLSTLAYNRKEYDTALDYSLTALDVSAQIDDIGEHGAVLYLLTAIHNKLNRPEKVMMYGLEATAIFEQIGSLKWRGLTELEFGKLEKGRGQLSKAADWYAAALDKFKAIQYHFGEASCHYELYALYKKMGKIEESILSGEHALQLAQDHGYQYLIDLLTKEPTR